VRKKGPTNLGFLSLHRDIEEFSVGEDVRVWG